MTSRFFAANSDSDSESDSGSSSDSDTPVVAQAPTAALGFSFESSDDEEEKRVVRSQKDKRFDLMRSTCKDIKNHLRNGDWKALTQDYDTLQKQFEKAKKVMIKEGIPPFYWHRVLGLQDAANALFKDKPAYRKLDKAKSQALNRIRQTMRKENAPYAKAIKKYLENPAESEEDVDVESEEEDEESDVDGKKESKAAGGSAAAGSGEEEDEEEEDEEMWDQSSGEDSDTDTEMGEITRDFWVKKTVTTTDGPKEKRVQRQPGKKKFGEAAEEKEKKETVDWSAEAIQKRLKDLLKLRGKRGTNRNQLIADLRLLATKSTVPVTILKIQTSLVLALFDLNLNRQVAMTTAHWSECFDAVCTIMKMLEENPMLRLTESADVKEALDDEDGSAEQAKMIDTIMAQAMGRDDADEEAKERKEKSAEDEKAADAAAVKEGAKEGEDANEIMYIKGNLYSFVTRLVTEYISSLRIAGKVSVEYVMRLRDETKLLNLLAQVTSYYKAIKRVNFECMTSVLLLELVSPYYEQKLDVLREKDEALAAEQKGDAKGVAHASLRLAPGSTPLMRFDVPQLARFCYKNGSGRLRVRALLFHVYHLALHSNWLAARDLILMSHLPDYIHNADLRSRILYNRVMAQMGMCAFRCGLMKEAHSCLTDLFQHNRQKELLAQGTSYQSYNNRDLVKEAREKNRLYPRHQHINLTVLEATHLISAMFLETPLIARRKRRQTSKMFRRHFENYKRQAFNGPPESTRELVLAAARCLIKGDGRGCFELLQRLRIWGSITTPTLQLEQLRAKCQQEALKLYLIVYAQHHDTVTLVSLVEMFGLSVREVKRTACQLIMDGALAGAIDQPSNSIVMNTESRSKLQSLAMVYTDRVLELVDQTERLMNSGRSPNERKWNNNNGGGGHHQQRRN